MQYEDKYMSFQDLKKSRGGFDTLQKSLEQSSSGTETKSYNDDRYWKIDLDFAINFCDQKCFR